MTKEELIELIQNNLESNYPFDKDPDKNVIDSDYNPETKQLVIETESGDFFDITINKR